MPVNATEPSSEAGFYWGSSVAAPRPARFQSWSELGANKAAQFDAISQELQGEARLETLSNGPRYSASRELVGQAVTRTADGMDVSLSRVGDGIEVRAIANPYAQGWNYQSFGVWNTQSMGGVGIASSSFGAATPAG